MVEKNIWEENYLDEYELGDLDINVLKKVEALLSIKLPITYIKLLKEKNGGRLIPNKIFFGEEELTITHLLGISKEKNEGILMTDYFIKEWDLPSNIVVIYGDGNSFIFLDYRNHDGDNPPVSYIEVDSETSIVLAEDFDDFIRKIEPMSYFFYENSLEDKVYTIRHVEEVVEKGEDIYEITSGIEYLIKQGEGDVNWVVDQLIKLTDHSNNYLIFEVGGNLLKSINTDGNQLNKYKIDVLLSKLEDYSLKFDDFDNLIVKFANKLKEVLRTLENKTDNKISINGLWEENFLDEYELDDLDMKIVEKVENILSVKLPHLYLKILQVKNGGRLIPNMLPFVFGEEEEDGLEVTHLLGVSEHTYEGILTTLTKNDWGLQLPPNTVIISRYGDQAAIVLDYRNHDGDNPPISYLDSSDIENMIDKIISIDFEEFISKIKPLSNVTYIEENKEHLANITLEEIMSEVEQGRKIIKKNGRKISVIDAIANIDVNTFKVIELIDLILMIIDNLNCYYLEIMALEISLIKKIKNSNNNEIDYDKAMLVVEKLFHYEFDSEDRLVFKGAKKIKKLLGVFYE